jgi:uncharacterized metal-binding protein
MHSHMFILPRSGPCNFGQLANQAAVELTREGMATMLNLPALAAHRPMFVQAAEELARTLMVVDGCAMKCARSVIELLGIPLGICVVLTDFGIEKSDNLELQQEDLIKVKNALKGLAPRLEAGFPADKPKCMCAEEW